MRLLHSDLELVVKSGFIYVPLLFDPDIAKEIQDRSERKVSPDARTPGGSNPVLELEGNQFVKSVNIQSVLANYEKIHKHYYEQIKNACLGKLSGFSGPEAISSTGKLQTIVLKVMPYFIRKSRGLERKQLSDEELLELIGSKIDIPHSFIEQAEAYLDSRPLLQRLQYLDKLEHPIEPLEEGPTTGEALRQWLHRALQAHIVEQERVRLNGLLRERELWGESQRKHIATLLYIADNGSFELDGFGFSRIGSRDDYLIYKHTGEYILKDYYARSYLFPDCRVAISTIGPLRPLVVETYKHPFLLGHSARQEICIRGYQWPDKFTADNIIKLLEEGINALLYGYDARRRNGYHSLDPTLYYVKTIEFEDYLIRTDCNGNRATSA